MSLKRQLKEAIRTRGISAAQLSRKTGIPKQRISDWLAGSRPRDMNSVKRAADVLGVSIDYLLFGDSEAPRGLQVVPWVDRRAFIDLFMKTAELPSVGVHVDQTGPLVSPGMSFLLRHTGDLAGVRSLTSPITKLSDSYEEVFGWSLEDTREERWMARVHPNDRLAIFSAFEKYILSGVDEGKITHRLMRKNGNYMRVHTTFMVDFDLKLFFWNHKT